MGIIVKTSLILMALLMLVGCSLNMYATRYAKVQDSSPPEVLGYQGGETPTIYIKIPAGCGWGQKVGTVTIYDAVTAVGVASDSRLMEEKYNYWFTFPNLASGSYVARLSAEGVNQYSCSFTVHNPNARNFAGRSDEYPPRGLFACNDFQDSNNDGALDNSEIRGLGKSVFNFAKDTLLIFFVPPEGPSSGNLMFQTWNADGQLIGETASYVSPGRVGGGNRTGPNLDRSQRDFLDKLFQAGPGKYRIVAVFNGQKHSLDIIIE